MANAAVTMRLGWAGHLADVLVSLRPRQWVKNCFVLAAIIYSGRLESRANVLSVALAFSIFCFISSAGYLLNDVLDSETDREHPIKGVRPISLGRIGQTEALMLAAFLAASGLLASLLLGPGFLLIAASYLTGAMAYSLFLKRIVGLDVVVIAGLFVLRSGAGAVAIGVAISPWLYAATILSSVFLLLGKRRAELVLLSARATVYRTNLKHYRMEVLDRLLGPVAILTFVVYSAYCLLARGLPANHLMALTVPFAGFGLYRYYRLLSVGKITSSPEEAVFQDGALVLDGTAWAATSVIALYLLK